MAFNGFNERTNYIHNGNDKNKSFQPFDNSFAQMRTEEHKTDVQTSQGDKKNREHPIEEVRGTRDKFIIRNNNMNMANKAPSMNDPVFRALRNNSFKH